MTMRQNRFYNKFCFAFNCIYHGLNVVAPASASAEFSLAGNLTSQMQASFVSTNDKNLFSFVK